MIRPFTCMRTLALAVSLLTATAALAGDGTKDNPYTVSELNAQKDALAASGNTVWVKANITGLGTDGSQTVNDENNRKDCAVLLGDDTGTVVGYSYEILGSLALDDLTNKTGLLVRGIFRTGSTSGDEPEELHFSIGEIHNALSLEIKNGFRGYHIQSQIMLPKGIVAASARASYSSQSGKATLGYTYYNGDTLVVFNKNAAHVLIAKDGIYDFVLTSAATHYQAGTTGLACGKQAGQNTVTTNNRYLYRFVATAEKVGFERNSDNEKEVTLNSKDEIYLNVNSLDTNFFGHWSWETDDKKWITWTGKTDADFDHTAGISVVRGDGRGVTDGAIYNLRGQRLAQPQRGINIQNGKKYIVK